jgi:hypothetical protein
VDLVLSRPEVTTVSASVVVPPGFQVPERTFELLFEDGAFFRIGASLPTDLTFTVPVPSGIGATCLARARSRRDLDVDRGSWAWSVTQLAGIAPGTSDAMLELRAPPIPISPEDGAIGVEPTTDLVWSGVPDAVYLVVVNSWMTGRTYVIVTGETHARVPELPQHWGLQPGVAYAWSVQAVGPYPGGIAAFTGGGVLGERASQFSTGAAGWTFTAK